MGSVRGKWEHWAIHIVVVIGAIAAGLLGAVLEWKSWGTVESGTIAAVLAAIVGGIGSGLRWYLSNREDED